VTQESSNTQRVNLNAINANGVSKYANQAMLVKLSISKWTAIKTDENATQDVLIANSAEKEAGAFKKKLISRSDPEFKAINRAANAIRSFHSQMTMPWDKSGRDLLPAKAFLKYKQRMTELEDQFNTAVRAFCSNYAIKLNQAQIMLGSLFQAADYPSPSEISGYYGICVVTEPIPMGENLKVGISQQFLEEERRRIEEDVRKKTREAHKSLYKRLETVASRVVETLSREEPNFRKSFISQVMETADMLEMLDLENDSKLQESAQKIKEAVLKNGYETLKEDEDARKDVVRDVEGELDEITKAVEEMA
jgi:hypothetical protein